MGCQSDVCKNLFYLTPIFYASVLYEVVLIRRRGVFCGLYKQRILQMKLSPGEDRAEIRLSGSKGAVLRSPLGNAHIQVGIFKTWKQGLHERDLKRQGSRALELLGTSEAERAEISGSAKGQVFENWLASVFLGLESFPTQSLVRALFLAFYVV